MPAFQSSAWCFTVNNPDSVNEQDEPSSWPDVDYIVYQLEEGELGTVHWQGYLYLKLKKTLVYMKTLHSTAHFEPRKGTHNQARDYCMKEPRLDGPYEYGTPPNQGGDKKGSCTWSAILDLIKDGISDRDLMELHPGHFARQYRGIEKMRTTLLPPRDEAVTVNVFWGPPGTGKTQACRQFAPAPDAYWKDPGNKWFDDYSGQKTVVFDEFKCNWFTQAVFNRIIDRYPMRVETKGGSVQFQGTVFYITSQVHPREWYPNCTAAERASILRRLTNIVYYGEDTPAVGDAVTFVGFHDAPAPSNIL